MCHCQNSLLVAFPSKFIVSAVEFSVCRNKHFPFYFILIFFLRYPVEMLRNLAKVTVFRGFVQSLPHLGWTSVWTEWDCVCFVGLEPSASISAFCLSPSCLLLFPLLLLNCRGWDSLHSENEAQGGFLHQAAVRFCFFWVFFCSVVSFFREKFHWWSGIFQKNAFISQEWRPTNFFYSIKMEKLLESAVTSRFSKTRLWIQAIKHDKEPSFTAWT